MARRKRVVKCEVCHTEPVRRGGRHWCAVCYGRMKRPKKTCVVCEVTFAADMLTGRRCRGCVSTAVHAKHVEKTYSISADDYKALLVAQHGRCAICLRVPRTKRLAVDHDHKCCAGPISCGKCVRGLCCRQCNRWILGAVRDDTETLLRAVAYLNDPPARKVLG